MITKNEKFWVVTIPTETSTLNDICFECDIKGLQKQFLGGLNPDNVLGFYSWQDAHRIANNMLNMLK